MSAAQKALDRLRSYEVGDRVWACVTSYNASHIPILLWCKGTVQSVGRSSADVAVAVVMLDEPVVHSSGLYVGTQTVPVTAMRHAY